MIRYFLALLALVAFPTLADTPFVPRGATVLVDNTARQVTTSTGANSMQYRVRNMSASAQYFGWATPNNATSATPTISTTAPSAGTPTNAISMLPNSVEIFTLPANVWMQASSATGFEVTPGEGQ
jgi:hypothetical protein